MYLWKTVTFKVQTLKHLLFLVFAAPWISQLVSPPTRPLKWTLFFSAYVIRYNFWTHFPMEDTKEDAGYNSGFKMWSQNVLCVFCVPDPLCDPLYGLDTVAFTVLW